MPRLRSNSRRVQKMEVSQAICSKVLKKGIRKSDGANNSLEGLMFEASEASKSK